MPITATTIDGVFTDGLDYKDITGNGLIDILAPLENGGVEWFEQTNRGSFTKRTLSSLSLSGTKQEGGAWVDVEGNGNFRAAVGDQGRGELLLYSPGTSGVYTDTSWSYVTLQTGRTRIQAVQGYDIDGDGEEEIIFAYEGNYSSTGGIVVLDWDGVNSVENASSWTAHEIVSIKGAWWFTETKKDLSGDGRTIDFAFTARQVQTNSESGVYIAEAPVNVFDTWTVTKIEELNDTWLHLDWGNFFGYSDADIVAQTKTGELRIYDRLNNWGMTALSNSPNSENAAFNVITYPYPRNRRDRIVSFGLSSALGEENVILWSYNGTAWEQESVLTNEVAKADDRVALMDIDGSGFLEIVSADTDPYGVTSKRLFYLTFTGFSQDNVLSVSCSGGKFNGIK